MVVSNPIAIIVNGLKLKIFYSLAVYEWNVIDNKRNGDYVLKNCSYTGIAVSPDSRTIFAVGSDRKIKEIGDAQVI